MRILFLSNAITPHLLPLCDSFCKLKDVQFKFIETKDVNKELLPQGWRTLATRDYIVDYHYFSSHKAEINQAVINADLVLVGTTPIELVKPRLHKRKLTFRYSERIYKNEKEKRKHLFHCIKFRLKYNFYDSLYLLCASAYAAIDYNSVGCFKKKTLKWGYFPQTIFHQDFEFFYSQKSNSTILWAGRFIDWKHPDLALEVAKRLKIDGIKFHLNIVGDGCMDATLKNYVKAEGLTQNVSFLGSMSPEDVRKEMDKSGICLCTSDYNEGWGAIVNEAMNSGCAVVGSHAMGSVPYLLNDGQNGFIYENENIDELYAKTKELLINVELQRQFGERAYHTILSNWNSDIAADRLVGLVSVLSGKKISSVYKTGICSIAPLLTNNWIKGEIQ